VLYYFAMNHIGVLQYISWYYTVTYNYLYYVIY